MAKKVLPAERERARIWATRGLGVGVAVALVAALVVQLGGVSSAIETGVVIDFVVLESGFEDRRVGSASLTGSDFGPKSPWRYFSEDGVEVRRLAKAPRRIVRVPRKRGIHFMWPAPHVGHVRSVPTKTGKPIRMEVISTEPRVFALDGFLTGDEADHLISFAQDDANPYKLAPSTTGTESWTQGGRTSTSSTRTSENAFDVTSQVSRDLKHRAFDLLRIAKFNDTWSDGIQILKYEVGQAYVGHHDYFPVGQSVGMGTHNFDATSGGSNRYATLFLYLSDVEEGGHTVFPRARNVSDDVARGKAPAEAANLFAGPFFVLFLCRVFCLPLFFCLLIHFFLCRICSKPADGRIR
jgi:hypothetical protein